MRTHCLHFILTIASLFPSLHSRCQVNFTAIPKDFAIVPRDIKKNNADILFSGNINATSYKTVRFLTYQNGNQIHDQTQTLNYYSGVADFNYKIKLKAGKFRYNFKVIFYGTDSIVKLIKDVAIGDIFIIQGQSNAVANQYNGTAEPQYLDSFIRSFGTSAFDQTVATDTFWYIANGNGYYNKGCIGQWALVLAKKLLDSFGIPLGIMNGAIGGTSVAQHQRYTPQPNSLNNIYGRLLYRMQKAGVANNVRSIMYFQGESDGPYPAFHDSLFRILYKDWFIDYKGIQQNYFVQVRTGGCGSPTAAFSEVQRQFEFTLNKLKVISANGLNAHDGCHYGFVNGYELLGKEISALAGRDLYNSNRKTNIDPPNISTAFYSNASLSEIVLEMKQPKDSIFADANFFNQFYINGDNGVSVIGGYIKNNKVYLTLNQGTCKTISLTYLTKPGSQPWVKNKTGAGLIGCHKIPIQKTMIKPIYSGCPNSDFFLGEDSIPGYTYKWIRKKDGSIKKTARIKVNLTYDDDYIAIIYYKNITCNTDTFAVSAIIDKTGPLFIGNDTVLCNGNKITIAVSKSFSSVNWKQNKILTTGYYFTTDSAGKVWASAKTTLGCSYQDSMTIKTSKPQIKLSGPYKICPDLDTLITVKNTFLKYTWNGFNTNQNYFKTKAGKLTIEVEDSFACKAFDTAQIIEFKLLPIPSYSYSICKGDSVSIQKPNMYLNWFYKNQLLPNYFYSRAPSFLPIILQDSSLCKYNTNINISAKKLPIFKLGADTTICPKQSININCNYPAFIYEWNGKREYSNYFVTDKIGQVICKIQNNEGCIYSDTIQIFHYAAPVINIPSDTTICEGTQWQVNLQKEYKWKLNGNPIVNPIIIYAGNYEFIAEDNHSCTTNKNMALYIEKCINSMSDNLHNTIKTFPNPCFKTLALSGNISPLSEWKIIDISGRIILTGNFKNGKEIDISSLENGIHTIIGNGFFGKFIKLN